MAWAPDYATTAEARSFITRDSSTADDTELALAVSAASRAIDRHTGRQFGQVAAAEERAFTPRLDRRRHRYRPRWIVDIDDLMTTTDLVVTVGESTVTTHQLRPPNAPSTISRPWTELVLDSRSEARPVGDDDEVTVTAIWGWTAVPDTIKQATLLQTSRFFARRNSPFGIAGSPDLGSEMRLLDKVDADVAVILRDYVREWGAV